MCRFLRTLGELNKKYRIRNSELLESEQLISYSKDFLSNAQVYQDDTNNNDDDKDGNYFDHNNVTSASAFSHNIL